VHARFYSDIPGAGFAYFIGVPSAAANEAMGFDITGNRVRLPGRQTQYFTAGSPPVVWEEWEQALNSADGQLGPFRVFRPGEQVTEPWGAFPLHPAPNMNLAGAVTGDQDLAPSLVSASRAGDTLTLDIAPFSDSIGDTGTRFQGANDPGGRVTGSYEIDENGKKIASGNAVSSGPGAHPGLVHASGHTSPSVNGAVLGLHDHRGSDMAERAGSSVIMD
jgi:hypothetical protein